MQAEAEGEGEERVVVVNSEEELDEKLKADAAKLVVLLSTVTWCRPCKTLKRPLEVPARPHLASCHHTYLQHRSPHLAKHQETCPVCS